MPRIRIVLSMAAFAACAPAVAAESVWDAWRYVAPPAATPGSAPPGARSWQLVRGRSFCQFSLQLPVRGSGDVGRDFASEWSEGSQARGSAAPPPVPTPGVVREGWQRASGIGVEELPRIGRIRVRQVSWVGHGQRMSALVTDNDDALCGNAGEAFLSGAVPRSAATEGAASPAATPAVVLPVPPIAAHSALVFLPRSPDAENAGRAPALTAQSWKKTNASYSHWGQNPSPGEMAKLFAGQGWTEKTWQFAPDGRYRFRFEVWSLTYHASELRGMEETGRWRQAGDRLVVEPDRAVTFVDDKASGRRLAEQPARTGRSEYATRMHWLPVMKQWYLVLAPVDGRPTEREGRLDEQPGIPNAYLYGPPARPNLIR